MVCLDGPRAFVSSLSIPENTKASTHKKLELALLSHMNHSNIHRTIESAVKPTQSQGKFALACVCALQGMTLWLRVTLSLGMLPRVVLGVICVLGFLSSASVAQPRVEVEPNNTFPGVVPSVATPFLVTDTITGTITAGDQDMIRITTLGVVPSIVPVESGVPGATRRIFEVVTSGDATLDIFDPTTGRVMTSSDDATGAIAGANSGGGGGGCRAVFDLIDSEARPTDWVLLIKGFWPNQTFTYEVRYLVEQVELTPPTIQTVNAQLFTISSVVEPGKARWFRVNTPTEGSLQVGTTVDGLFPCVLEIGIFSTNGTCVASSESAMANEIYAPITGADVVAGSMLVAVCASDARWSLPIDGSLPWSRSGIGVGELVGARDVAETYGVTRVDGGIFQLLVQYQPVVLPCPADFNQDGGITGDDVSAFFMAYQLGDVSADVNNDGGITGDDVATFFIDFEAGC